MAFPARCGIIVGFFLSVGTATSIAAETPAQSLPDRPFCTLFASSLENLLSACERIFDSVERPDLFASMDARLQRYNDFAGIDRDKPLGMMFTWGHDSIPHVVFLPVTQIDELLKTATFDVVEFHRVGRDQYEIERPGSPYHVLVRGNYACIAESLSTIRAIRATPDQLTRRWRDQYDLVLQFDLRQIPISTKKNSVDLIRRAIEPSLQTCDDEAIESGKLRRILGGLALDLIEQATLDANMLTFGIRLDQKTGHLWLELVVDAVPKSRMAIVLNQAASQRSKFSAFLKSDAAAAFVTNLTTNGAIQEILETPNDRSTKGSQLESGFQLMGESPGDLSLIVALNGSDVGMLNDALPSLLLKFEKSGHFEEINENFDVYRGVVLHRLIPRAIPKTISDWIDRDVEMIVGQGNQTVWMGIGSSEKLLDHLETAIQLIDAPAAGRSAPSFVRAQFQARKLPELVASNLLIPNLDSIAVRKELLHGGDGFSLKVEPVADGVKLSVEFEEGFVRLIGRDWIRQIESMNRE